MTRADRSHLPEVGPSPSFTFPPIVKRRLANGLSLWCVEQRALPLITVLLIVPAGSASDPRALPGLASLTGDMLDEGSGAHSAIEIHHAFARIGVQLDIEVGADSTVIGITALSRFIERGLALLADCIVRPSLLERDVNRIRELRLNRLVQLRDLAPAVADRAFMQTLYGEHPYGHLAIGTEAALREMSVNDVVTFHAGAYLASRATLVAVGDIEPDMLERMAHDAFGAWTRPEGAGPAVDFQAALVEPPSSTTRRLTVVHKAGAAQSELRVGHVAARRDTPDYVPLLVLNTVLGGQFVSRINLKLREEKGYTYGARTSFDFRKGRGPFLLQTSVQTEMTADAIKEIFQELSAIRDERPVTEDELALARYGLTRGYARNFETSEQLARAMTQLVVHGLPDDYYDLFPERILQTDAAAVARAATKWLQPEHMLTLIVGDRDALEPTLGSIGLGAPTVLALA